MIVFVLWSCWGWIFNWIRAGELSSSWYMENYTSTYIAHSVIVTFRKLWGFVGK